MLKIKCCINQIYCAIMHLLDGVQRGRGLCLVKTSTAIRVSLISNWKNLINLYFPLEPLLLSVPKEDRVCQLEFVIVNREVSVNIISCLQL